MRRSLAVLSFAVLFSFPLIAQSNYAVLSGSVNDPQSHAVVSASIELVSSSTGAVRRTSSNDQGFYEIPGVQPGDYMLVEQ